MRLLRWFSAMACLSCMVLAVGLLAQTPTMQETMAQASAHLKAGEPVKAVAVLEEHVSRIDGNRAYLRLLEDAYRAHIRVLLENNDVEAAAKYRARLSILDRTAANDPALQPALQRVAAQS